MKLAIGAALAACEQMRHHIDSVSVVPGGCADLPRLPCERLYLGP